MIYLSIFCICNTKEEALDIANEILGEIDTWIGSYEILSNEPYWKIDGWFVVRCRLENTKMMDKQKAQRMLDKISDKWKWTLDSACSAVNMGAKFIHPQVQFVDCVFD
jgi:hypothetical protein